MFLLYLVRCTYEYTEEFEELFGGTLMSANGSFSVEAVLV